MLQIFYKIHKSVYKSVYNDDKNDRYLCGYIWGNDVVPTTHTPKQSGKTVNSASMYT